MVAVAKFTDLPSDNSSFGRKTAAIKYKGSVVDSNDYEVFFRRDATDNPTGSTPNWLYYWNQTSAGDSDAVYLNDTETQYEIAKVPAMYNWLTYSGPWQRIDFSSAIEDPSIDFWFERRDGSNVIVTGIDLFHTIIIHENTHVQQIIDNNTLPFYKGITGSLDNTAGSGWSFNVPNTHPSYNHFDPGIDNKPGVASTDDDMDMTTDEADEYLLNVGLDVDLDTDVDNLGANPTGNDIDIATANDPNIEDVEEQAQENETNAQDGKRTLDWGDPGKQHGPDLQTPNANGEINPYDD